MNRYFAEWYRAVNIEPNDDQLKRRWKGLEEYLSLEISSNDISELVRQFFQIALPSEGFGTKFVDCFVNNDSAFDRKYYLEISLLAGVALFILIDKSHRLGVFAALLTVSASFPNRRATVPDIYEKIVDVYHGLSASLREDLLKPDVEQCRIPMCKDLCDYIKANAAWDANTSRLLVEYIDSLNNYLKEREDASQWSSAIYSEDSQILWWLVGKYSKDLNKPFRELGSAQAALAAGKELADLVTTFPGPYSYEAVLYRILEPCKKGPNETVTLSGVIVETGGDWRKGLVKKSYVANLAVFTPVVTAIAKSIEVENDKEWLPSFKAATRLEANKITLSLHQLACQLYIECLATSCFASVARD